MSQGTQLMFDDASPDELQVQIRLLNTRIIEANTDASCAPTHAEAMEHRTEVHNLKAERSRLRDLLFAQYA